MDIYDQSQAALELHLSSLPQLPTHPTTRRTLLQYENVEFEAVDGVGWVRGTFAPTVSARETAGDTGYSRIDGLFQISVFWPIGKGSGEPRRLADLIIRHFKSGTVLSEGEARITVVATWRGPALKEDEWYHVPITVEWFTHHNEI